MHASGPFIWLSYGCAALLSFAVPIAGNASGTANHGGAEHHAPVVREAGLRSRYVEGAGGVPLNVVEAGQPGKPTLVFIHGLGQSHLSWKFQLRSALADDYHLVAYDLRGHGNSGKPWLASDYAAPDVWAEDLERVLEATDAQQPVLVTWSYGTWVAVDFLKIHRPEAISGLVMIGGLGGLIAPYPPSSQERSEEGERLSSLSESGWLQDSFDRGEGINRFFVRKPVDPDWFSRTAAVNAMLPPYARPLILARSFDNSGSVERISMPTWFVVGDQDVTLSVEDATSVARRLPDAQLTVFEGSGHLPFAEDPAKFNEALSQFARQAFDKG